MRYIERVSKPKTLAKNEKEWTAKFIADDKKKRPDNSKYGHGDMN